MRSSLLPIQNTVNYAVQNIKSQNETKMDIKKVEQLERGNLRTSEEILTPTNRLKEIVKPGDYSLTIGAWRKYNPPTSIEQKYKESRKDSIKEKTD